MNCRQCLKRQNSFVRWPVRLRRFPVRQGVGYEAYGKEHSNGDSYLDALFCDAGAGGRDTCRFQDQRGSLAARFRRSGPGLAPGLGTSLKLHIHRFRKVREGRILGRRWRHSSRRDSLSNLGNILILGCLLSVPSNHSANCAAPKF